MSGGCEYVQEDLPAYSSKYSKKKYRQHRLSVILLYKAWRNVSYRDLIGMISSNPAFIGLLSLSEIPHFTTIQKFSERIDKALIGFVFDRTLKFFAGSLGSRMMVDSTGYSINYHSYYYDKRLDDFGGRPEKGGLKPRYAWMTDRSLLSHRARLGCVHGSREFGKVSESMDGEIVGVFKIIVGDKGCDSGEDHVVAKRYGLSAAIPAGNGGVPIHRAKGKTGRG